MNNDMLKLADRLDNVASCIRGNGSDDHTGCAVELLDVAKSLLAGEELIRQILADQRLEVIDDLKD